MRVLFISNYGDLYGANRSLLSLVRFFKEKGCEILVFVPKKGGMSKALDELDVRFKVLPYFSSFLYVKFKMKYILWPLLVILNIPVFFLLVSNAYRFKPSVIYSNTLAENLGVFISKIIRVCHIIHIREFMTLDHGAVFIFGEKFKHFFLNMSDRIIFVSNAVKNYHYKKGELLNNYKVIYNGVPAINGVVIPRKLKSDIFRFGIVGIIDPGKGHLKAFEYFEQINHKMKDVELHVFGEKASPFMDILKSFVENRNLQSKIIFHGFVNDTELIYQSLDALLMFSVSEGFGRVTIEAMARGIPVIGYNNGGTSEIINNSKDGYLFSDYNEFESAVLHLRKHYSAISLEAYKRYSSNFSENVYVDKVYEFVSECFKL